MFDATVKDGHVLALATLGLRDLYGKRAVTRSATSRATRCACRRLHRGCSVPRLGAQTVHMPFGSVYTSLQTGVVDFAENGVNVYDSNKHYEVAPVLSMTEHEANNSVIWVSDKLWASLSDEQKGWVQAAASEVGAKEPAKAIALEHKSLASSKNSASRSSPGSTRRASSRSRSRCRISSRRASARTRKKSCRSAARSNRRWTSAPISFRPPIAT